MKKRIFAVAMAACITALTGCASNGGTQNSGKKIPTGMPDYSAYETEKVMWIGGWNPPPPKHITSEYDETYDFQTLERYREMADCGINVGICVYEEKTNYPEEFYNALDYAEAAGIKLLVLDYDVRPEIYDANTTAEDLQRKTASYNNHPAFLGHHAFDEPNVEQFDSIGALKKVYTEAFPGKNYFVNLFPSYSSSGSLGTSSGYEYYFQNFIDRVSPDLLSVDYYPLKGSASRPVLYTGLLSNYELYAENAKLYDIPFYAFIGTTGVTNAIRQPSIYDLRFMVNAALMFGADGINHFTYWWPYELGAETDLTHAMIRGDGTVTQLYQDSKTVNHEVLNFDHVLLSYDWQGIMLNVGTLSEGKVSSSFKAVKHAIEKHDRIKSIESERDLAIGVFEDESGYDGFYMLNYENPGYTDRKNKITVTFKNADKAIIYYRGNATTVNLNNGKFTYELEAGDAIFAVPVKG